MAQNEFAEFEEYAKNPDSEFEEYLAAPQTGPGILDPRAGVPDSLALPNYSAGDVAGAIGTGLVQGATFGTAPYISALADFGSDKPFGERVEEQRAAYKGRRAASPIAASIADVVGSLPASAAFAPFVAGGAAQGIGKLGMIGAGMVDSAAQNTLRGVIDRGNTDGASIDAGVGLAGGALGHGLGVAANRGIQYAKKAAGWVPNAMLDVADFAAEKLGSTEIGKLIANPSGRKAASAGLDVGMNIPQEFMDMGAADAISRPVVKDQIVSALTAAMGKASDKSRAATVTMVGDALDQAAQSGATVGAALRTIYQHTPANASSRAVTAIDAFAPITTDMDPRAMDLRTLAAQLRGEYESGALNKAFGREQANNTFHATQIGLQNKPGRASIDEILSTAMPVGSAPVPPIGGMAGTLADPDLYAMPISEAAQSSAPVMSQAAPVMSEMSQAAMKDTNREMGRSALKKISAVGGALSGALSGNAYGGFIGAGGGMAAGAASGLLGGQVLDVVAGIGTALARSGAKNLTPAALASSWLENPKLLGSLASRPDNIGRTAAWVLGGAEAGGSQAVMARAFTAAMDPTLRSMFTEKPKDLSGYSEMADPALLP